MTAPQDWFVVILYAMFWPIRINGCVRRGRQPLLRGRDWFFDVHVQDGFYDGPGKRIMRQYWLRMMIPFALDIPWAVWIFASGRLLQLNFLVLAVAAMIHVNHLLSVRIAERQAQPYAAAAEDDRQVARVALSLAPRRLRDYTTPGFEWTLAAICAASFVWLALLYGTSAAHPSARVVFGVPLFALYTQAGMLIVKRVVIGWPSGAPGDDADAFMRAAEERRRYYVKLWDWSRAASVASLALWPLLLSVPPVTAARLNNAWLAAVLVLGVALTVAIEIKRKQIANLASRARPAPLPAVLTDDAGWPLCYEPSAPVMMLRSARGYSLNLGSSAAQFTAAYVAGLFVLIFVFRSMAP